MIFSVGCCYKNENLNTTAINETKLNEIENPVNVRHYMYMMYSIRK